MNGKIKLRVELTETDVARLYAIGINSKTESYGVRGEWITLAVKDAIGIAYSALVKEGIIK